MSYISGKMSTNSKKLNNLKKLFPILSNSKVKKKTLDSDNGSSEYQNIESLQSTSQRKSHSEVCVDVEPQIQNKNVGEAQSATLHLRFEKHSEPVSLTESKSPKSEKSTSSSSSTLVLDSELDDPKPFPRNAQKYQSFSEPKNFDSHLPRTGRMSVPVPTQRREIHKDIPVDKKLIAPKPLKPIIYINTGVYMKEKSEVDNCANKLPISPIYDNVSQVSVPYFDDEYVSRSVIEGEYQSLNVNPIEKKPPIVPVVQKIHQPLSEVKSDPITHQKVRNLQNVEAFYWNQLKKIKQKQDYELFKQTLSSDDLVMPNTEISGKQINQKLISSSERCRSVSPALVRKQDVRYSTPQMYRHTVSNNNADPSKSTVIDANFVRDSRLRSTIASTDNRHYNRNVRICTNLDSNKNVLVMGNQYEQHTLPSSHPPIFRRGSLLYEASTSTPIKDKKVSFLRSNKPESVPPKNEREATKNINYVIAPVPFNNSEHIYGEIRKPSATYASVQKKNVRNNAIKYQQPSRIPYLVKSQKPIGNNQFISPPIRQYGSLRSDSQYGSVKKGVYIGSESESGSEGGEVRRIMLGNNKNPMIKNIQQMDGALGHNFLTGGVDNLIASLNLERCRTSALKTQKYEDWNPDGKNRGDANSGESGGRSRTTRRDDPRRHTLGGDLLRTIPQHIDPEGSLPRGYPPPSSAMLFDDDPGIMSEVETASTGFRRGGKQRSSLPVVRTPSKTLERPLGLVFLQYRSETKRALLPNEITSIDTVKALFVRSFPKQLTMEYLDSPLVKIYIHDSSKDMFYELEDLSYYKKNGQIMRSHLRDIRDRSVLRLFESADVSGGAFPGSLGGAVGMPPSGPPGSGPPSWDQDQSYFSEPEFDSDYHHQHIHKSKVNSKPPAYYMGAGPPSTLPRGGSLIRAYSPAGGPPIPADRIKSLPGGSGAPPKPLRAYGSTSSVARGGSERCYPFNQPDGIRAPDQLYSLPADRIHNDGYMSSPERSRGAYEEPYYTQYVGPPRGGMTPVIDEESGDPSMMDDQYSLYSVKIPNVKIPSKFPVRGPAYEGTRLNAHTEDIQQRMRVEHMERQLANLTGLVQKALQAPGTAQSPREFLSVAPHFRNATQESTDPFLRTERPPKLGKGRYHKSVSFEKSVSFSDEPPDMNSPKQHSPQHSADSKPPKPAIKSSTLPRMSSQERERLKPIPPPKPKALAMQSGVVVPGNPQMVMLPTAEYLNQLKLMRKKCDEFRMDMRNLRRVSLAQTHAVRELICEMFTKFRTVTNGGGDVSLHEESIRLAREEEMYKQEMLKLEVDLTDLEATVEQLRGNVINRKTRVNMLDVEKMALVLSKSSKTVADLKVRFPALHEGIKNLLSNEMEKVVRQEKFLKEEPERLEMALRRCKKLTGTLVTLKRLASVQEQRLPCESGRMSPGSSGLAEGHTHDVNPAAHSKGSMGADSGGPGGMAQISVGGSVSAECAQRTENALDALLDELQTFARPPSPSGDEEESGLIRRLRSCASISGDSELSPPVAPRGQSATKPPVPERNPDLLQMAAGRRAPPPPPPRTSSRSPLASPAAPLVPLLSPSNSSSCDSVDSQDPASKARPVARHDLLEQRHQELLKKQKALQEQYARLQQIQRGGSSLAVVPPPDLKKTGSESNLLTKMGLNMTPAPISGSLTHLAGTFPRTHQADITAQEQQQSPAPALSTKVYETDIL